MKIFLKKIVLSIVNLSFVKLIYKIFYFFYYLIYKNSNISKLTIFVFHDVNYFETDFSKEFNLNVKPEFFKKQIDRINREYNIIHPKHILNNDNLPVNAALITFDDGFNSAFENGIEYLISKKIPCIMFLNMNHIINNTPLISASICYLTNNSPAFLKLMNQNKIKTPYFLNLNKDLYNGTILNIPDYNKDKIEAYQGKIANYNTILHYSNSPYVSYGNHLFEHWNSSVLSKNDFEYMIHENQISLSNFTNHLNIFAFPNGQPVTCFNKFHIDYLTKLGFTKIFYSSCGISLNFENRVLDRVILTEKETSKFNFYSLLGRSQIFNNNIKYLIK